MRHAFESGHSNALFTKAWTRDIALVARGYVVGDQRPPWKSTALPWIPPSANSNKVHRENAVTDCDASPPAYHLAFFILVGFFDVLTNWLMTRLQYQPCCIHRGSVSALPYIRELLGRESLVGLVVVLDA